MIKKTRIPSSEVILSFGESLRNFGMISRGFADAMGARWRCSYCETATRGDRCANCGAPRGGT